MSARFLLASILAGVVLVGCRAPQAMAPSSAAPSAGATVSATSGGENTVVVMTHDSFNMSEEAVKAFQDHCGCRVRFLKAGDAGLALTKAILSKGAPLADVFYGVDNTFMSRALREDIFEPYASPALTGISDDLKLDASNRLSPVDFGYVNPNFDRAYFAEKNLPLPRSLRDLTDPAYREMLVVENPATSSPGLAFLLTTIAVFAESGDYTYLDFWSDLRKNDVQVAEGWEDAYYGKFSGGSGEGTRPLVISYATSPAAEVYFADPQPDQSPTGNIAPPGQTFRQIEFVGILRGASRPDLAKKWVDFMLGPDFQQDIPLQMWVYPARTGTPLPEVFTRHAQVPLQPIEITPEQIDANRDRWLEAWTQTVLR